MVNYLIILTLLFVLEIVYFRIADKFNIIDKPNERSSHSSIVLRGGGVIFLIGSWLWSAFYGFQYPWFLLGLTLIAGISFVDDIHSLPDSVRLVVQFVSMGLLIYQLIIGNGLLTIDSPLLLIVIGIAVLIVGVGIINAYNFMDGINGITGGYSVAVLLPLLYLDTKGLEAIGLNEPFIAPSFLVVTLLSALVFCFFNFRKKAKCFAGDVGSVGVAFMIVFALGRLVLATGDVTYILFLAAYGVDTVLTICHRIMLHEHLGEAHRKHAFQLLANELHIPHTFVSTFYMVLQLAVSFGLILSDQHWLYSVIVLLILCLVYLNFMKEYYHLHAEYLNSLRSSE